MVKVLFLEREEDEGEMCLREREREYGFSSHCVTASFAGQGKTEEYLGSWRPTFKKKTRVLFKKGGLCKIHALFNSFCGFKIHMFK